MEFAAVFTDPVKGRRRAQRMTVKTITDSRSGFLEKKLRTEKAVIQGLSTALKHLPKFALFFRVKCPIDFLPADAKMRFPLAS